MKLESIRRDYKDSNSRLRRARRLYAYIIFEHVIGDQHKTALASIRAQKRGLYSEKTSLPRICMSLLNYLGELDIKANPGAFKPVTPFWRPHQVNATSWLHDVYQIRGFYDCRNWFYSLSTTKL